MRANGQTLRSLLAADYTCLYAGRSESAAKQLRSAPARFISNPSLHAVVLIRLALMGPPRLLDLWRQILLAKHSIDLERGCSVGPGLNLPHPFGIMLGGGVEVGMNVVVYHNVTLGAMSPDSSPGPRIGDRAVIHTNTMIAPSAVVGEGATVGANSFVDGIVPPRAVFARDRIVRQPDSDSAVP
jgi:serine acetyltransferase